MGLFCYFVEQAARPVVKAKLKYSVFLFANLQIFQRFRAILVDKDLAPAAALAPA